MMKIAGATGGVSSPNTTAHSKYLIAQFRTRFAIRRAPIGIFILRLLPEAAAARVCPRRDGGVRLRALGVVPSGAPSAGALDRSRVAGPQAGEACECGASQAHAHVTSEPGIPVDRCAALTSFGA